jgi:hypothetical protein
MTARFVPNRNLARDLAAEPPAELRAALEELGRDLSLTARELALQNAYDTGDYYRGIQEAEVGVDEFGRLVARVNATDHKSNWLEYGTKRMPAKRIMRRAAARVRRHQRLQGG